MTSKPFASLAADANVLASAAVRRAALKVFGLRPRLRILTTEFTMAETRCVIGELATYYRLDHELVAETLENFPVEVIARARYEGSLLEAR